MADDLRVLTVRQPFAWAISEGKSPENRTRNIVGKWRGKLAIHAGLQLADEDIYGPGGLWEQMADLTGKYFGVDDLVRGAIVCVVDLVGVHHSDDCAEMRGIGVQMCSPWAIDRMWHLDLANPRPITPIPARGRLGLWKPDPVLKRQIMEALND